MKRCLVGILALLLSLSVIDAGVSSGIWYSSGTVTADGNSGWQRIPTRMRGVAGYMEGRFKIVPANLTGDETVLVTIDFAWSSAGVGAEVPVVSFTSIDNGNAEESIAETDPMPEFYRVAWDVAGVAPTPSLDFVIYFVVQH